MCVLGGVFLVDDFGDIEFVVELLGVLVELVGI